MKTAIELGQEIASGALDPVDLVEGYLNAIEATPAANCYARLTPDQALAEAEAARDRAAKGQRLSALDGVPISWKDLVDTGGVATEAGSAMLAGRVPERDALIVTRAKAAGLISLGKTHLSELAFSGLGINPITATPANIHGQGLAPGGSSSGAAASVAYGLAAGAVGSDTGGSVRVPAAWNDLVGLKTSFGRVPVAGVVPLCTGFDTIGPIMRNVADCAAMLSVLDGEPAAPLDRPLKGLRFATLEGLAMEDISPAVAAAYQESLACLKDAGATLEAYAPIWLAETHALSPMLYGYQSWTQWGDLIAAEGAKMFPQIRARFEGGRDVSLEAYQAAAAKLADARTKWAHETAGFDAVLCPTTPNLPPKIAEMLADEAAYIHENLRALRNTRIGNLLDLPSVSLPTGQRHIGLMAMGQTGEDHKILGIAAAIEGALAGMQRLT